jgi:hypothetical protein
MAFKRLEQFGLDVGGPDRGAFGRHGHDRSVSNALASGGDKNGVMG